MTFTFRGSRLFAVSAVLSCAAGCGSELYSERFEDNTVAYFRHSAEVAAALGQEAVAPAAAFRPPTQFQLVRGKRNKEGEDTRQPYFLRLPLPGLVNAWQAEVRINPIAAPEPAPGGNPAPPPLGLAHCFLLAEAAMKDSSLGPDARFDLLVVNRILGGLGLSALSSREVGDGLRRTPYGYGRFGRDLQYDVFRFDTDRVERGTNTTVVINICRSRPKEAAVIFVYPTEIARGELFNDRLPLSLASLKVTGDRSAAAPRL
ncbi:MAG: hypothetical protein AAF532_03925 [Planctomycetota bacterium]